MRPWFASAATVAGGIDVGTPIPGSSGSGRASEWRAGHVEHAFAEQLAEFSGVFAVTDDAVRLQPALESADEPTRSAAIDEVVRRLAQQGALELIGHELYAIAPAFGATPWLRLERSVLPLFGARAHGVHVNGLVRRDDGLHVWIATRASDRHTYPGQLDNIIGGGQPAGLGVRENLAKEAKEEAGFDAAIASRARSVGSVSYRMDLERGLRDDLLFLYDLELREDELPRNTDGEVASFELWPVREVMAEVDGDSRFKFNCNLVLIDLFLREGLLTPEHADYAEIASGLNLPRHA